MDPVGPKFTQKEASELETDHGHSSSSFEEHSIGDVDYLSHRTQSVTDSVFDYRWEYGRRYHSYQDDLYLLPNDEPEQDRLELQHHLYRITIDGPLYLAPIPKATVGQVLDVGCGTGIWAIEFAEDHPSSQVLGMDISPIQPVFAPKNCSFRIDNVEEDWMPDEYFDFIHSRAMIAAIRDWSKFIQQAFEHLNPGGYIELQDFCFPLRCQDTAAGLNSKMILFNRLFWRIGTQMGWDLAAPMKWRHNLEAAGFTDIHMQWINWPVGPWAKGKKNKLMGKLTFMDFFDLLGSVGPLYRKFLDYTSDETETLIAQVRKEMRDQKLHLYQPVCFCYAKKPGNLPTEAGSKPAPAAATTEASIPATDATETAPASQSADAQGSRPEARPATAPAVVSPAVDAEAAAAASAREAAPEASPAAAPAGS